MKKNASPKFKASIAIEALKDIKTPNQIGSEHEIHPVQVGMWKKKLTENAHLLFSDKHKEKERDDSQLIDRLYRIIGQRETELEWLKKKLHIEP
jgi:transposase-like protein